jgi:hypothetical protein
MAEDDRVRDLHHGGLEMHREQDALGLGPGDLGGRNERSAATRMTDASTTSPASTGTDSRSTVVWPSSPTSSMRNDPGSAITADCSVDRKSSLSIWATFVFESGDHGPMRCGCALA